MKSILASLKRSKRPQILCHFNHYFGSASQFTGKSTTGNREQRIDAVQKALGAVHGLPFDVDVRVCGFKGFSLIPVDIDFSSIGDPQHIVYSSIEKMFESLDKYDYFLNIEDDILIGCDVLKTAMEFNEISNVNEVYLPNRMERTANGIEYCVDLLAIPDWSGLCRVFKGISLSVARNPHSGLSFLSKAQMRYARDRVVLSRRDRFLGGFMASAYANLHEPFLLWRSKPDLTAHHVIHLDNWLASPAIDSDSLPLDSQMPRGHVDQVTIEDSAVVVRGWAITASGKPVASVFIELDGYEIKDSQITTVYRPDVARIYAAAAVRCGFEVRLPLRNRPSEALAATNITVFASENQGDARVALTLGEGVQWPATMVAAQAHGSGLSGEIPGKTFKIPEMPHMDAGGLRAFTARLKGIDTYLEYGCGGSTVLAANSGVRNIISVETSDEWAKAVRAKTNRFGANILVAHCDLGEVGDWGRPRDETKIREYYRYASLPWSLAKDRDVAPQLVLIDGRFRVACFLYSLICAPDGTTILFDDYTDRPHYHVVEQFCEVQNLCGRMAVFLVNNRFSIPEIAEYFARYSLIAD